MAVSIPCGQVRMRQTALWPQRRLGAAGRERAMRRAAQEAGLCRTKERWPVFTAMSDKVYPAFAGVLGGHKPLIKVRSMTSRWGVCFMAKRQITFALQLYHMPPGGADLCGGA